MTVRASEIRRPSATLRFRILLGLGLVAFLTLLSVAFFFWQLTALQGAIERARQEQERLTLLLETSQQVAGLMVTAQEQYRLRIPDQFYREVGAAGQAVQERHRELTEVLVTLSPADPMRVRVVELIGNLENMINIADGAIHHARDSNWPAVNTRVTLLAVGYGDLRWNASRAVFQARDNRIRADAEATRAMQRMVTLSIPVLVLALVIAAAGVSVTARNLTRRVEELGNSARRLAEGHFDERAPVKSQDELGQLANSFNVMATELESLYAGLEQQIAERTAALEKRSGQLETAAKVAQEASSIRDVRELLDATVELISAQFGFYHAGIFLVDDAGEYAVLRAANSEGGQRMLARGHKLRIGQVGIVGNAAYTGEPHIALDVGEDAVFFDNPDLPQTRSEAALPLKVRELIVGVLDVQSTEAQAFAAEDVAVLQVLANQVALALQNARLLEDSQRAVEELETLYGRRVREAWMERSQRQTPAFRYTRVGVEPASPSARSEGPHRLVAPILLRDQHLGTIVLEQEPDQEPWTPDEVAMVREVSTQIGLALENARLLEETQRRADRERIIADITAQVRSSTDLETILRTAVRELGTVLGTGRTLVQLAGFRGSDGDSGDAQEVEA
jgi:GAF domain-containing protein/HAMP domain-containing protein